MAALINDRHAIAIDATDTTVTVCTDEIPAAATVSAWELAAGRLATVVITTSEILEQIQHRCAHPAADYGWNKLLAALAPVMGPTDSGWPAVPAVVLKAGHRPVSVIDGDPVAGNAPLFTTDDLSHVYADTQPTHGTTMTVHDHGILFTATHISDTMTVVSALPDTAPDPDSMWLPETVATMTSAAAGIIYVAGAAHSGRTSLAHAIGYHAKGTHHGLLAAVGATPWPLSVDVTFTVEDAALIPSTGVRVVIADDPHIQTQTLIDLAAAGLLVIAVVHGTTMAQALTAAHAHTHPAFIRGVIVRSLLPTAHGHRVPVDGTLCTPTAAISALREQGYEHVEIAVEAGGHTYGTLFDTALAAAVRTGRVSRDTAAGFVHNTERFLAAEDRLASLDQSASAIVADDWNWSPGH